MCYCDLAVILGPVGLLVGAASVAIGMGVMQIPEEQRNNMRNHAATSIERARYLVCDVSDSMSSSCAKFSGSDPAEIVGNVMPEEIVEHCSCFIFSSSSKDGDDRGERSHRKNDGDGVMGGIGDDGLSMEGADEIRSVGSSPVAHARLVGDLFRDEMQHNTSPLSLSMNLVGGGGGISGVGDNKGRGIGSGGEGYGLGALENENVGRRVACGRKGENNSHTPAIPLHACEAVSIQSRLVAPLIHKSSFHGRSRCSTEPNSLAATIVAAASMAGRYGERSHHSR